MAGSKRMNKKDLQDDLNSYAALQTIAGFAPANASYTTAAAAAAKTAMETVQALEVQKKADADAARDDAAAAEFAFHSVILGVKDQVKAQFGKDSNELQALGLKKTSEYKKKSPVKTPQR